MSAINSTLQFRILSDNSDGLGIGSDQNSAPETPAGAGFFLNSKYLVTCAHVINNALGLDDRDVADKTGKEIQFWTLSNAGQKPLSAKIVKWLPITPIGDSYTDDVCILQCNSSPQNFLPLRSTIGIEDKSFQSFGWPQNYFDQGRSAEGKIGSPTHTRRIELSFDLRAAGFKRIEQGFSGAPVIIEGRVVGMIASVIDDGPAYMVPIESILDIVPESINIYSNVEAQFHHVQQLLRKLDTLIRDNFSHPGTVFDIRARNGEEHADLLHIFNSGPAEEYTDDDISPVSLLKNFGPNPILISASGGSGKSSFLRGMVQGALCKNIVPFFLDLASANFDEKKLEFETILDECTFSGGKAIFECATRGNNEVLLIIDGLSDCAPDVANHILMALEAYVRKLGGGFYIVIADRLNDRVLPVNLECKRMTIVSLPIDQVERHLGEKIKAENLKHLLSTPFFLDLQLKLKVSSSSKAWRRTEIFKNYFNQFAPGTLLSTAGEVAFHALVEGKGPILDKDGWKRLEYRFSPRNPFVDKFISANILVPTRDGNELRFRHQLLQDYLISVHLVSISELEWRAPIFDGATLNATSFDALGLAAEQLDGKVEVFLSEVYDWNYIAVVDCIQNLYERLKESSPVPVEFKNALFVLNAEKVFDRFEHTASRIRERMGQIASELPEIQKLTSETELRSFVKLRRDIGSSVWRQLYTYDKPLGIQESYYLWDNPFIAWTAASVFRRQPLSKKVSHFLMQTFGALRGAGEMYPRAVGARWRIVHILGIATDDKALKFLADIIYCKSENKWVRYGAVRSFMEMLSRFPLAKRHLRIAMLEKMASKLNVLDEPILLEELRNVAILSQGTPLKAEWQMDYKIVLRAALSNLSVSALSDRKKWQRQLERCDE